MSPSRSLLGAAAHPAYCERRRPLRQNARTKRGIQNLALLLQRLERLSEAAAYWLRYLEIDRTSKWADRAKRALKLCEMQIALAPNAANARRQARHRLSLSGKSGKKLCASGKIRL